MKRKTLLLPALAFAAFAPLSMACSKPAAPSLPDPSSAVTPQMVKAKNDVKAFIDQAEAYLKCNISTNQHNAMVDEMKSVADNFNSIVRAYKERMAG
ncbi:hypothetical protein KOI40_11880 [Aestuariicella sp. G3-2]|uniref:hypothetical protein n=1 Tax=Pseudomaricurvus albidus TaxID=2842452 RepID=UPI001C0AC06D|nr:hypothetical protein [Aestuariicella albida]MBU3070525.1 hypothetical protein [Aestuariicella albida]